MRVNTALEDQSRSDDTSLEIHALFFERGYNIPIRWIYALRKKQTRWHNIKAKPNFPTDTEHWIAKFRKLLVDLIRSALELSDRDARTVVHFSTQY